MKKSTAYLFVIIGASLWGFIGLFTRELAAAGVSVMNIVTIRNFGGLVLLALIFLIKDRSVFKIQWKHLPIFFGTGIVSVLSLAWCYFNCQQVCSLAVAGILLYLAPSFVVIMSAILWKEPLTKRKILALVLALLGCALVSGIMGGDLTISLQGLLLGVGAGLSYALYTVFAHYGLQHYGSYTVIMWTFIFAGVGSLFFMDVPTMLTALGNRHAILPMLGLVVVATVLPYFFYTRGLSYVESGRASIMASVEPVVAALVGIVVFGEAPRIWTVLGMICVLGGVVLLAKEET